MIQSLKYSFDFKEIILVPIADCHIGANINLSKLIETINFVKETKNAYAILNGDILDMCIPDSVSSAETMNDETLSPATALALACEYFKPIKDKILLVTEGNHENRQTKLTAISPLVQLCTFLEIPDKYVPEGAVLFIKLKQRGDTTNTGRTFSVYVTHGTSNSSVTSGKIKKLQDLSNIIDVDCYIVAHSHLPACFKLDYYRVNPEKNSVLQATRLFVNTTAYLRYGGYGQRKAYVPSAISQPKIYLQLKRNQTRVKDSISKEMNCII